jgi:hypothetical protein
MNELKKLRELALAYQNADTPGKHHGAERDWDYGVTPELILSLLERLEKAEADAKRYRWLRQYTVDSYLARGKLEALDAEIDAAMAVAQLDKQEKQ